MAMGGGRANLGALLDLADLPLVKACEAIAQLDLCDDQSRKCLHQEDLVFLELSRRFVDHAEHANFERGTVGSVDNQWSTRVEADVRLAQDGVDVFETFVLERILNNKNPIVRLDDGMRTESLVSAAFVDINPDFRFKPLTILVNKTDQSNWSLQNCACRFCYSVE
jgi:hypothetical protein